MTTRRRDGRLLLAILAIALVAVVVTALVGVRLVGRATASPYPPAPADARSTRVLPVVDPLVEGPHSFITLHPDGTPVVPDPCRPMHWTLNRTDIPDGGEAQIREAFAFISAATGLQFVQDGDTTETANMTRPEVQRDLYGNRIAPVLVTFVHLDDVFTGGEAKNAFAVALPQTIETDGANSERVATGQIMVDSLSTSQALSTAEGRSRVRQVLMHEMAHLVGLDHVDDPQSLMNPVASGVLFLGPGDKQGLAIAGQGRCFADA